MILSGAAAGSTTLYARPRPQTKFYCSKMIIQYRNINSWSSTDYFILSDVKNSIASPRFYYVPVQATGELVLNFEDSPRLFEGDNFGIYAPWLMNAGIFLVFSLFGWEEQA